MRYKHIVKEFDIISYEQKVDKSGNLSLEIDVTQNLQPKSLKQLKLKILLKYMSLFDIENMTLKNKSTKYKDLDLENIRNKTKTSNFTFREQLDELSTMHLDSVDKLAKYLNEIACKLSEGQEFLEEFKC